MAKNLLGSFLLVTLCASFVYSSPAEKPKQKVFLFLKEPLQDEESIVIRLDNQMEESIDIGLNDKPVAKLNQGGFQIIFQKKKHGPKNEILIDITRPGIIQLDVYDFYGKKLGNLFTGYQSEGQFILKEDENWKVFNRFKGIVYFTLTVDGQLVTKKLLAKVE